MTIDSYVTNAAWLSAAERTGRPDTIDDIADQFERRPSGAVTFWADVQARREASVLPERMDRRAG